MQRAASGIIRRIQYGVIPQLPSLVVQVGNRLKGKYDEYTISEIVENSDSFFEYGYIEYLVYVSKNGDTQNQIFWQRFIKPPDKVEYGIPGEEETLLV